MALDGLGRGWSGGGNPRLGLELEGACTRPGGSDSPPRGDPPVLPRRPMPVGEALSHGWCTLEAVWKGS